MKVTMLLADAAQEAGGKLHILGGGWSLMGPEPSPMAIALKFAVPWDQTNIAHRWMLELVEADGQVVMVETPVGTQPVQIGGEFEVGRPPGLVRGTPIDLPLAVSVGPLPLSPGRYEWRLTVDDGTDEDWVLPFTVRQGPSSSGVAGS